MKKGSNKKKKFIGAHVSASGGVENAPLNALKIGADAFALFPKNQRQWVAKPYSPKNIEEFKNNMKKGGFSANQVLPHGSYLINLGNTLEEARKKAREAFLDELQRCESLGLQYLNIHPGAHLKKISEEECLREIATTINWALEKTRKIIVVLENTAGQGTCVGHRLEELQRIIELIEDQKRIGVCLDTCHLYAAGYDIKSAKGYEKTMQEFEHLIGFEKLKGMHINDSKVKLASRVDRHQSLGQGELGWKVFERIMKDERLDGIPMILETTDPSLWPDEIKKLKSFLG